MENKELLECINFWQPYIEKDNKLYEIAVTIFFVKLEKLIIYMFKLYLTGGLSSMGHTVELDQVFSNDQELDNALKKRYGNNFNYIFIIQKKSHYHIKNRNPFDTIFTDKNLKHSFTQLKAIRNYVVHESEEAWAKYRKECGVKEAVTPNDYLIDKLQGENISNYSYYVKQIKSISEILLGNF